MIQIPNEVNCYVKFLYISYRNLCSSPTVLIKSLSTNLYIHNLNIPMKFIILIHILLKSVNWMDTYIESMLKHHLTHTHSTYTRPHTLTWNVIWKTVEVNYVKNVFFSLSWWVRNRWILPLLLITSLYGNRNNYFRHDNKHTYRHTYVLYVFETIV